MKSKKDVTAGRMYRTFEDCTVSDLEAALMLASSREEKAFFRTLINLKLQLEQEKVVGEILV